MISNIARSSGSRSLFNLTQKAANRLPFLLIYMPSKVKTFDGALIIVYNSGMKPRQNLPSKVSSKGC